ncbi:unnamed protein product, partial [marine sediment metagenome]
MSYNKEQFESLIRRVLVAELGKELCTDAAVNLLLGTAAQESLFGTYMRQVRGPAMGVFQIEPATFNWLKEKYNKDYPHLSKVIVEDLEWDLALAIIFARLRYRAVPAALPIADDIHALAAYWK